MLFNSYIFVLVFLPITISGFFAISRFNKSFSFLWLFFASLFFYGWWNPKYVILILISIFVNFAFGLWLSKEGQNSKTKKLILVGGIGFALAVLCYFKYTNFFIENLNSFFGASLILQGIILPIGLSFYTFEQIAFLVDTYRQKIKADGFIDYCIFVSFFPRLIAGPIVRYQEIVPQLKKPETIRLTYSNLSVGMTVFIIGLFKKVALADNVAEYSNAVFNAAGQGVELTFTEAWVGALAYTFQLYFDFSGYSDMAIGLARMFNIRLPANFYSPYKATSIRDFWRRWHITLSRFLRDYLYIPLGGNQRGVIRRIFNLFTTMLIGGLWHGAGWTFIIWGGLHGIYLIIDHLWREAISRLGIDISSFKVNWLWTWFSRGLTFVAVVFAWVIFRSHDMREAIVVIRGMVGMEGISLPHFVADMGIIGRILVEYKGVSFSGFFPNLGFNWIEVFSSILSLLLICWFMPNTQELLIQYKPAFDSFETTKKEPTAINFKWKPNLIWAISLLLLTNYLLGSMDSVKEFLYYQF